MDQSRVKIVMNAKSSRTVLRVTNCRLGIGNLTIFSSINTHYGFFLPKHGLDSMFCCVSWYMQVRIYWVTIIEKTARADIETYCYDKMLDLILERKTSVYQDNPER
jgi:hypothetical protein